IYLIDFFWIFIAIYLLGNCLNFCTQAKRYINYNKTMNPCLYVYYIWRNNHFISPLCIFFPSNMNRLFLLEKYITTMYKFLFILKINIIQRLSSPFPSTYYNYMGRKFKKCHNKKPFY